MTVRIYEALRWASSFLQANNLEEPAGEWLLLHHTKYSRAQLLSRLHDLLPETTWQAFQADVKTLQTGIPVQYIVGYEQFYGRTFAVNQDVLIPRPETEELIIHVLQRMPSRPLKVLDVGTGSGVIATTLKLERPDCEITAIDISDTALHVAKENAKNLGADVRFLSGDLVAPVIGQQFDVIVSNPPYIATGEKEYLATQVKDFEPETALFAGQDGLDVYRRLASELQAVAKPSFLIALEIGANQGEQVKRLFAATFQAAAIDIVYDINGKDRIVLVNRTSNQ
ncbi:peptide chain release factor N(5)-glutamine methyltransferase [Shouchella lonarensis]|uniref:Release factor glutamine methyltransferase n=1 Tax=Shouchella lonarensis TaxID=1464122 RepID=A0A1G6GWM0_9BACI|nr:peptide chain release factor N(5)-glutamine methyltransferase [Shouchella lonarensis]SDB86374.1 release factor glutamine methyltransferase [Shouchella lonarensis]